MIGSVSYMLPAVLLYRRWHTRRGAVLSLAAATACAAASALLYNLFLIFPVYARLYGMSMDEHRGHGKGRLPVGDGPVFHDARSPCCPSTCLSTQASPLLRFLFTSG